MRSLSRLAFCALPLLLLFTTASLAVGGCDSESTGASETTTAAVVGPTSTSVVMTSVEAVTAASAAASTSTEAPAASRQTATTLASTEVKLSNGHVKSLGFIHDVWTDAQGRRHLTIDYCDILYGDEATPAARATGAIGPDEETPIFVRNQSTRLREWQIADGVTIVTCTRVPPLDPSPDPPCNWSEFVSFWKAGVRSSLDQGISDFYGAPWWIERSGDTVVKITEQFIS